MLLFFFHFWAYDLAKKHKIGNHICLTYCLFMQLIGLAAVLIISLWQVLLHFANQRGSVWNAWVPWGFTDWLKLFLSTAAVFAPIMLLISLLPYRYIKRESEKLEEEKKNRAAALQNGKEISQENKETVDSHTPDADS